MEKRTTTKNPIIRVPKALAPVLAKAATERGIKPSLLVAQAIRFYLAATDPQLVAAAVSDALKPIASDIRHIKYQIDKQASGNESAQSPTRSTPRSEADDTKRRNLILELTEQKRQQALERIRQKSSSSTTPIGTNHEN